MKYKAKFVLECEKEIEAETLEDAIEILVESTKANNLGPFTVEELEQPYHACCLYCEFFKIGSTKDTGDCKLLGGQTFTKSFCDGYIYLHTIKGEN